MNCPDFTNAEVGMKVYSRLYGFGEIIEFKEDEYFEMYPILVKFANGPTDIYTLDGKQAYTDSEPTLFFVNGEDKYALEPPVERRNK